MGWHQVCKTAPSPRPARPPKALTSTSDDRRSCRARSWTGKWWMRGWSLASKVPSPPQTKKKHRPRGLHGKVSNKKRKQGRFFVFIRYGCLTHPHKCTACRPPRSCKSGWECCTSARPMGSSRSFHFPGANTDIQCEETGRTRECVSGRREEEDVFLRPTAAHGAVPSKLRPAPREFPAWKRKLAQDLRLGETDIRGRFNRILWISMAALLALAG